MKRPVERGEFRAKREHAGRRASLALSDLVAWSPPPQDEQDRLALPILKRAWALVSSGWCQHALCLDVHGKPVLEERQKVSYWSLAAALGAAVELSEPWIWAEYARRAVRRVIGSSDLVAWNDQPLRKKREVLAVIHKAIRSIERSKKRRGGWAVTLELVPPPRVKPEQLELPFPTEG